MIKKYFKYILFTFAIVFLTFDVQARIFTYDKQIVSSSVTILEANTATINQNAENKYKINICDDTNVVRVMRLIGYILIAVKILVPIGLILFGTINFAKAMIANDESTIKKVTVSFAFKLIAAIIIFVLPTIINFIMSFIDGETTGDKKYETCRVCIFDPKNCVIPK